MAVKFANNVSTTLASAINATQTTISVADASGLPSLSSGDYIYLTIDTDTASPTLEVVKVTAVSSNDLTVVRGQDGTTASSFSAGVKVELRVTAAALGDISSQAQTAADTESVSKDGDTMTGVLNIHMPSPILRLKDTTDDDDHKIQFTDTSNNIVYEIATQNGTSGDAFTFYSASQEIVHRIGSNNRFEVHAGSVQVPDGEFTVTKKGDFFPSLNLKRTDGVNKTNQHWEWQIGSSGNLNLKNRTGTTMFPMIATPNGDIGFAYNSSGANPVLLLDQSNSSASFSGAVSWSGGSSSNANTAYTYSQVGHLPLSGGTLTGTLHTNTYTPSNNTDWTNVININGLYVASHTNSGQQFTRFYNGAWTGYFYFNSGSSSGEQQNVRIQSSGNTQSNNKIEINDGTAWRRVLIETDKNSMALTGTPTAPTASAGTDTTQIATTAFVTTAIDNIVDAAPGTLDTLNELAAALGDDADFSTTVTNSIATKLSKSGGTMTGNINMGDNDITDVNELVFDTGARLINNTDAQISIKGGSSNVALQFTTSDNTRRGVVYGNSSNQFGLLDSDYNWFIRHTSDNRTDFLINNVDKARIDNDQFYHVSQIRAPIFYDRDNTSYYGDFNNSGTSLKLAGKIVTDIQTNQTPGWQFTGGATNYGDRHPVRWMRSKTSDSVVWEVVAGAKLEYSSGGAYSTSPYITLHTNTGRIDASAFYDTGDTNYFVNPGDTGTSAKFAGSVNIGYKLAHVGDGNTALQFDTDRVRLIAGGVTKFDSNNTYLTTASTIPYSQLSGTPTIPTIPSELPASSVPNSTEFGTGASRLIFGAGAASGSGVRNYFAPRNADNTAWNWDEEFGYDHANSRWYFDEILYVGTHVRTPIVYDHNDSAYYVNPADMSELKDLRTGKDHHTNAPRWDTSFYVAQSQHWYGHSASETMYLGESANHVRLRGFLNIGSNENVNTNMRLTVRGHADATESMRAPVFYDYNNTAFYVNPHHTTTSAVLAGRIYSTGGSTTQGVIETDDTNQWWIKLQDYDLGIYWDTTNNHIDIRNTYGELQYNGNEVWHEGNDGSGSGLDADKLDGIQASSFLRSDTADSYSSTITATGSNWYLWSLGARGASAGQYGIGNRSSDGYRQLTFHVPNQAAYSSSGTVPSFGWYSNGADQLMKLDSASGNLWIKGYTQAGLYYDKDDTSYYVNPNDSSVLHDITTDGVVRSTNNANVDGPNFNVSTTNKTNSEYAYRVDRSGTVVGGIHIDGRGHFPYAGIGTGANASGSYRLNMGGHIDMNNNAIHYASEVHFNDGPRFKDGDGTEGLILRSSSSSVSKLRLTTNSDTARGYLYANSSNEIGLLDSDHAWAIRHSRDNYTEFRINNSVKAYINNDQFYHTSSIRAPIYYDRNNTDYYIHGDNESRLANLRTKRYFQWQSGQPTNNLGDPTVTEMALFEEQFNNKTQDIDTSKLSFYRQQTSSSAWTEITDISDTNKKKLLRGAGTSGIQIPNEDYKYRIEIHATNYVFANALYMYWSSDSHNTQVHIWKRNASSGVWSQHTNSSTTVSSWPGHLYLPFSSIAWQDNGATNKYDRIRIEFTPNWSGHATYGTRTIKLYKMQIWGGYPAGRRTPYYYDENLQYFFPQNIQAYRYYDRDNTAYYTDQSGTSVFNHARFAGTIYIGSSADANNQLATNNGSDIFLGTSSKGLRTYRDLHTNSGNHKYWHAGNDGSGSLLDADKLDGNEGSYYLNYNNLTNKPTIPTSLPANGGNADTVDNLHAASFVRSDTSDTFGGNLTSGNNVWIRFAGANATDTNDGKIGAGVFASGLNIVGAQTTANTGRQVRIWGDLITSGGDKYWHAGNDGSGSGLDADKLDGLQLHTGRNDDANKVVRTDGNGYIQAGWINTTSGNHGTTTMDRIYASNDGYIRYYTPANFGSQISSHINYNNIQNKPSIPSVGNGTMTITAGTSLTGGGSFTANQSGNSSVTLGIATPPQMPANWKEVIAWDGTLKKDSAVKIHGDGYLTATYLNMTHGVGTRNSDTVFYSSNDDYIRKNNASGMRTSLSVYSKTESDNRYVNVAGDTMTGTLNYRMLQNQTTGNYNTAGDSSGFSVFYATGSASNKPSGTDHAVTTLSYSSAWQVQEAADWRTNARYIRKQENGTWSSWQRVFADDYHPNADRWTTSRALTLSGDVTGSVSFNGSQNVTMVTTVGNDTHTHSKITERSNISFGSGMLQWCDHSGNGGSGGNGAAPANPFSDWHHHLIMNHANSGGYYVDMAFSFHSDRLHFRRMVNGTLNAAQEIFHDGYHPNADKWTTARTLTLSGDVTGSVSFDGSANATLTTDLALIPNSTVFGESGNAARLLFSAGGNSGNRNYFAPRNANNNGWRWDHEFGYDWAQGRWYFDAEVRAATVRSSNPFYGTNNSSYYLDPDSNSRLAYVIADGWKVSGSGTKHQFYDGNGDIEMTIDASGNVVARGNVTAYGSTSDIRLKENIETIPDALEKVQKLDGVTFDYKKDGTRSTGLIAQQLQEVLPEVVYETTDVDDEESHLAVRYGNVVGLLVEAIKEQSAQIDALRAQIDSLEEKIK